MRYRLLPASSSPFRPPTKSSQRGRPMLWRSASSSSPIPIAHLRTSLDGYSTKQGFNSPRLQVADSARSEHFGSWEKNQVPGAEGMDLCLGTTRWKFENIGSRFTGRKATINVDDG